MTTRYLTTDIAHKDELSITIDKYNEIKAVEIEAGVWVIEEDLYLKYKEMIDKIITKEHYNIIEIN